MSIVAYTFSADEYCPDCIIPVLMDCGLASPAALDMNTEEVLWQIASANAIDYDDEYTYDSGDFPKACSSSVWDSSEVRNCGRCHTEL